MAGSGDGEDDLAEEVAGGHLGEALTCPIQPGRVDHGLDPLLDDELREPLQSSRVPMVEPMTRSGGRRSGSGSALGGASPEVTPQMTMVPPGLSA